MFNFTQLKGGDYMAEGKKDLILKNVERLRQRIHSLEDSLESEEKKNDQLENSLKNFRHLCWWDGKSCTRYTEISGLQESGIRCRNCHRIDEKAFYHALEEIDLGNYRSKMEEIVEEVKEEKEKDFEDVMDDLHEKIVAIVNEANVDPAD
jgi:hypothetical protein